MRTMDFYLALATGWVIVGNIWHAVLLSLRTEGNRPLTISEHAVERDNLLLVHRIVHSAPIIVFMPLILGYLLPSGHYLAALLLSSAAIFDSLETLTLNKRTAPLESSVNAHNVTAWVMALSYIAYAVVISRIADLSLWVYGSILFVCAVLLVIAVRGIQKRRFLIMQMAYFVLVSLVGVLAHIRLIIG